MRALLAALALTLLAGCAREAHLPSAVHQLGIHPARTASAEGLQVMRDRHSGVRLWVAPQAALTEADVQQAEMAFTPAGEPAVVLTLNDAGRATLAELTEAVEAARNAGCKDLILLKCTSNYPAEPRDANLVTIPHLAEKFHCVAGLSDHSLGTAVAVASVALGARVVEKHLTLSRADGDVDSAFSLEPAELAQLVQDTRKAWQALGRISFDLTESEQGSRKHRRSLYIAQDIPEGAPLTPQNIRAIRPGAGLPPKHLDEVLGCVATRNLEKGTPLGWDLFRPSASEASPHA